MVLMILLVLSDAVEGVSYGVLYEENEVVLEEMCAVCEYVRLVFVV